MKIVFLGSGEFGLPCLEEIRKSRVDMPLMITQPAHRAGRGRKPRPTAVAEWAKKNQISCMEAENINAPEIVKTISNVQPDLILVIAFGQKIGNEVIDSARFRAINVHASLLPKYRGAAPVNWAIINGEKETGVSIITLAEKMDAGDILDQVKTDIEPKETAGKLHDRLAKLSAPLLMLTITAIENGTVKYRPQDHSKATLAKKLKKKDGYLDFAEPAQVLERKIRGLYPWPEGSANYIAKKTGKCVRCIFREADVVEKPNPEQIQPGILDEDLNIVCGENRLKIKQLKPAGSKMMDFKSFVNGRNPQPGDLFAKIEK